MPFDHGTVTCRVCLLPKNLPEDALKRFAAHAAGSLDSVKDEVQTGWVSGRHLLERRIDDETAILGGHLHLCLRQAQRKVPAALLRAECRMAELAFMAENKTPVVNRKERRRIKEDAVLRLLPQMPPQLSGTYFTVDASAKRLYLGAASDKQTENFLAFFSQTTGVEPVPLGPELAARELFEVNPDAAPPVNYSPELPDGNAGGTLGQNFLTWLWFLQEETGGTLPTTQLGEFSYMIDGPLSFISEGNGAHESTLRKGLPTLSAEAKAALTVGKKLKRAKIILARSKTEIWNVTLDADTFVLRTMKLPEGEALEANAAFEERVTALHIFQSLLYALFERYLKEVRDTTKFGALQKAVKQWVRDREGK